MDNILLKISGLYKNYKEICALSDISFEISRSEIFGLLGPNGAGKTSLLRAITGINDFDKGEIFYNGRTITSEDRMRMGYLPEERGLYPEMYVEEHLLYLARLKGMNKKNACDAVSLWLDKFALKEKSKNKINELSKGNQQKVQFISAVIHNPEFLILDEPFSGFDPINADFIKNEIRLLSKNGTTILLSSHDMTSVEELCTSVALVNRSKLVMNGELYQLKRNFSTQLFRVKVENNSILEEYDTFSILNKIERNSFLELLIEKKSETILDKDVINELVLNFNLLSFEKDVPSINQIFLKMVKN